MRRNVTKAASWCHRLLPFTPSRGLSTRPVDSAPSQALTDIAAFRRDIFLPAIPFHFKNDGISLPHGLPAASRWFSLPEPLDGPASLSSHMNEFMDWPFPFELISAPSDGTPPVVGFREWLSKSPDLTDQILAGILQATTADLNSHSFFQLHAPLKLLAKALEFNREQRQQSLQPILLYIAQSSISDLPPALQNDLPTPQLVQQAGNGDVYNSSIWLGTEPTYTPLHRDPNPNLFYQLCSRKVVRLLPPELGDRVFFEVQVQIRQQASSRIRTTEMMEGAERAVLHEAVWANEKLDDKVHEAELGVGDALFIPKGWWHSVKSASSQGHLNASANWWFR
ncbi:JmjC domain-containing protein F-like protein [Hapsidospora chrysogenum ATCC 11550]|uniref:JmjC domain-containing protein F-like protein n=1 Tax=Hapsidospora chrysogenum (strain ATCC 11550 / CBS 779.69 / DSM 880 / IAM 14645 / JCM 23072 / IMI 49137) TaxID=857340 RepID=A0A086SVJ4_HAPC1|nr:JmjC domain-containing protein F-like protein [Hapsidospora chrysogenum ATCC 11550]